jgi:hypothetical protein
MTQAAGNQMQVAQRPSNDRISKLDLTLEEVAEANIEKLLSRLERNQIHGAGDNR